MAWGRGYNIIGSGYRVSMIMFDSQARIRDSESRAGRGRSGIPMYIIYIYM